MKRRMRNVYAMGHHYGGYDGDDYEEMCEYAEELYKKLDEIEDKIEDHPEHHRRGGYRSRHKEGEYEYDHRKHDGEYDMYDEGHRRGRRARRDSRGRYMR